MIRVGILTASDKGSKGERVDESGALIEAMVQEHGFTVVVKTILPDERELISEELREWCDGKTMDLILTTGGTGFSARDCMPEATLDVIERLAPGIPEAMRYYSLQITPRAMLSRGIAGIRKRTLIINLPGSPRAVQENLDSVIETIEHGIAILKCESI